MTQGKQDRPVEAGAELEGAGVAAAVLATLNALGVTTNTGTGVGASLGATDTQNKTDVNVPEVLTGMNAHTQKRSLAQESVMDNMTNQILQNGITQHHMISVNEINNADLIAKQAIRHTDLAIDREWNLDEQTIAAAATLARLIERLNNPTPPT